MSFAQIGQRAPGWEAQPAAPPRNDQRLLITPAARAVFAASGHAPPAASRDGGVIRRADAVEQLSDSVNPVGGESRNSAASRDDLVTSSRATSQAPGMSAEESAAALELGTLSSSVDVRVGDATGWSLAGLVSVCVREVAAVGRGSVDAMVRRDEDITSSGRGLRLHRAEQLVSAQIERALERGTDVYVGDSAGEKHEATSTLPLLVVDASRLGVDELVAANDGVAVSVGTPQRKVVPVDVGQGDIGVGIRVVMRLSVTVGPDAPSSVLRGLIENVSAFLADDRWESAP